jgi:hypothetical protein
MKLLRFKKQKRTILKLNEEYPFTGRDRATSNVVLVLVSISEYRKFKIKDIKDDDLLIYIDLNMIMRDIGDKYEYPILCPGDELTFSEYKSILRADYLDRLEYLPISLFPKKSIPLYLKGFV